MLGDGQGGGGLAISVPSQSGYSLFIRPIRNSNSYINLTRYRVINPTSYRVLNLTHQALQVDLAYRAQ